MARGAGWSVGRSAGWSCCLFWVCVGGLGVLLLALAGLALALVSLFPTLAHAGSCTRSLTLSHPRTDTLTHARTHALTLATLTHPPTRSGVSGACTGETHTRAVHT